MAAIDLFPDGPSRALGVDAPACHAELAAGSDSVDLTYVSRALLVGVAGNAKVTMRGSHNLAGETLIVPLQAGYNPLRVSRVWLTSLTASGIVAIA